MSSPYAGVGRRALATLIDQIPLTMLFVILAREFGHTERHVVRTGDSVAVWSGFFLSGTGFVMLFLFAAFYYIGMELTFGGTAGKLLTGLRVCDRDGSPLSVKGAVLRFLCRFIDGILLYLPAVIVVKSNFERRRIGDFAGGTVVVYKEAVYTRPAAPVVATSSWQP